MTTTLGNLRIDHIQHGTCHEAKRFAAERYDAAGLTNGALGSLPPNLFVFRRSGRIVGTIGYYDGATVDQLPSEFVYDVAVSNRGCTAEVGRLTSDGAGRSVLMISFMGYHLATAANFHFAVFAVKPYLERALRLNVGIETKVIDGAPKLDRVPHWAKPYFSAQPVPVLVTVDLQKSKEAFATNLGKFCAEHASQLRTIAIN